MERTNVTIPPTDINSSIMQRPETDVCDNGHTSLRRLRSVPLWDVYQSVQSTGLIIG